MAGIDNLGDVC